jgi:hypothetical protein
MNDCTAVSLKGVKIESSPFWKSMVLMNRDLALNNFGFIGLYFLFSATYGILAFYLKSMLLLLASSFVLALFYLISTIVIISIRPILSSIVFSSIIFLNRKPLKLFYLRYECLAPSPNYGNCSLSIFLGGVFGLFLMMYICHNVFEDYSILSMFACIVCIMMSLWK